jgi:2-keto-myo-inositol isomerase
MELVQKIGGERIACPPVGATNVKGLDLYKAAERYRHVLQIGDIVGVVPQVELWGFSTTLGKLSETAMVAIEAGHPKACVLADVYHLYKGGSGFNSVKALSGMSMQMFHMNDYPEIPREKVGDKDRIFPGDGVAPLVPMLKDLKALGFNGALSLELFNPDYWRQDALEVAKTGLAKMKAVVAKAGV